MSKPIFIIKLPKHTNLESLPDFYEDIQNARKQMFEEYHVLILVGEEDTTEFECFNSPYKEEEFTELRELIKTINDERRES